MGEKVKTRFCDYCRRRTKCTKGTHKLRNAVALTHMTRFFVIGAKIEPYYCSVCGSEVHQRR